MEENKKKWKENRVLKCKESRVEKSEMKKIMIE